MICHSLDELPPPPPGKTGWPWTLAPDLSIGRHQVKTMELPTIGLVTPSYNADQYLEETIRSVLLQGYPNLEYYIVDGCSTDNTLEVIRKYEPWLSGWVSEPDMGHADAVNKGWRRCSATWLGWMMGDDSYLSGALWILSSGIEECPDCDIVAGGALWTDATGRIIHHQTISSFDYIDFLLSFNNHLPSGSTLIRRSVVDTVGDLDISMNMICDTDYWMRAGLHAKVHTIPQEISTFRLHKGSKTLKLEPTKANELIHAYNNLFTQRDLPAEILKVEGHAFSFCYLEAARYALRCSDKKMCWRYLYLSFRAGWQYIGLGHLLVALQNMLGIRASAIIRKMLRRTGSVNQISLEYE
jgi:glycosyltransferase involved in cell wall biosynthesis